MARLHAACFTLPPPWSAEEIAATLSSRFAFALTRPAGFLLGQVVAGEAELLTLAVDPAARRQGIGRDLVLAFLDAARARSADQAFLEVAEDNAPARRLYEALGFAETGRRKGYYRAGPLRQDAVLMARRVESSADSAGR